jgi:arylsulfatase A-like enzyme
VASASTPYVVLIVLDGARPDYFSVPGIPHVRALMQQGTHYTNAWAGILESETPSGHAALATGTEPHENGILSFDWVDKDNRTVTLFNPDIVRSGAMHKIIRQAGVPTIAGLVHKKDPTAKVVALGGHKYYANDAMGGPDADVIMYYTGMPNGRFAPVSMPGHAPPQSVLSTPGLVAETSRLPLGVENHLAMNLAVATFEVIQQRVTLINLPEFDWPLGHVMGGSRNPAAVQTLMQSFDRDLAMLQNAYRKAGLLDRTLFVLTADHGTAPIYRTVSKSDITKAISDAGTSIVSDTYHTGSFLWLKDESRAAAAATNIAQLQNPSIQSVYFKEPIAHGGFAYVRATGAELFRASGMEAANQYLLRSFSGPNGPDLVVLFADGAASLPGGQAQWKGDHGGVGWESQHIPLVFSGPGIRHGYVSSHPARLIDIAPTVLALLDASTGGMSGTVLADTLASSSAGAPSIQKAQGAVLQSIVAALQTQSRVDFARRQ